MSFEIWFNFLKPDLNVYIQNWVAYIVIVYLIVLPVHYEWWLINIVFYPH